MRISYILLAYKLPDLLTRLVDRLDAESTDFLIHVDAKTDDALYGAMVAGLAGRPNVRFLEPRIECHWAEFGRVAATLEALRSFIATAEREDYAVLLSGQDYPLASPDHIASFFRERPGVSYMEHAAMPDFSWQRDGGMYLLERGRAATGQRGIEVMRRHWDLIEADRYDPTERRRVPMGLQPYHGSSWWALTAEHAAYVVRFTDEHPELIDYFANVVIPDEMLFQTVLLNSPLQDAICSDDLHYTEWGNEGSPNPKLLGVDDVECMVASGKLFARKFDPAYDAAVLETLDRRLGCEPPPTSVSALRSTDRGANGVENPAPYQEDFYAEFRAGMVASAKAVVPVVLDLLHPRSVVDVGCGTGEWLAEFARHGIADVVGIDGDWVPTDQLGVPRDRFIAHDLRLPLVVDRSFDLAVSLETAEHLPAESAADFVASLTRLAPVVLFSSAIPAQGGVSHLNEQWPAYWSDLFAAHAYVTIDCIRPRIWQLPGVEWWYAQNTLLFADAALAERDETLRTQLEEHGGCPAPLVHPGKLYHVNSWANRYLAERDEWKARAESLEAMRQPDSELQEAVPDGVNNNIYARMWDSYVDAWLQNYDAGLIRDDLTWPGDEWYRPDQWEAWYQNLFVDSGSRTWNRVVEIGPGSGKYTLQVLTDSTAYVRGYDVSERFMRVCERRCRDWIDQDRLSLHFLPSARANEMLADLDVAGWRRTVDAFFSMDSMVHVDLQYLVVYLLTAGLTLRPGGKLILSLADATSDHGFTYMLENISWTYPIQGLPSGKFEWLSPGLILSVLQRFGFEPVYLGHTPRDLLLVASLMHPEAADRFEPYLHSGN